jgi:hypothetical protein
LLDGYSLFEFEDAALSDGKSRLGTVLSLARIGIYRYVSRRPDASDDDLDVRIRNVMAGAPVNATHHFGEAPVRRFNFSVHQDRVPGREPGQCVDRVDMAFLRDLKRARVQSTRSSTISALFD